MAILKTRNPRGQFTKLLFVRCDKVFQEFSTKVIKKAKSILKKKKVKATGKLRQTLRADTLQDKRSFKLRFLYADYGAFVEEGVRGSGKQFSYVDNSENRKLGRVGKKYPKLKQKGGKSPFRYRNKMPPIDVLKKWFSQKGVQGRDKLGRFISHEAFAFIVQRNLFVNGMKPVYFYRTAFFKYYDEQMIDDIETAYALDIEDIFGALDVSNKDINFE